MENEEDDLFRENLDAQHEAEALLEMYRVVLAEREVILTGRTAVSMTAKPQLFRELEAASREARRMELLGEELSEEQKDMIATQRTNLELFKELDKAKEQVKLEGDAPPLQDVIRKLREVSDRLLHPAEVALIRE